MEGSGSMAFEVAVKTVVEVWYVTLERICRCFIMSLFGISRRADVRMFNPSSNGEKVI